MSGREGRHGCAMSGLNDLNDHPDMVAPVLDRNWVSPTRIRDALHPKKKNSEKLKQLDKDVQEQRTRAKQRRAERQRKAAAKQAEKKQQAEESRAWSTASAEQRPAQQQPGEEAPQRLHGKTGAAPNRRASVSPTKRLRPIKKRPAAPMPLMDLLDALRSLGVKQVQLRKLVDRDEAEQMLLQVQQGASGLGQISLMEAVHRSNHGFHSNGRKPAGVGGKRPFAVAKNAEAVWSPERRERNGAQQQQQQQQPGAAAPRPVPAPEREVSVVKSNAGFGVKLTRDCVVSHLASPSACADAGIAIGSKITAVNGETVEDREGFAAAVKAALGKVGATVRFQVRPAWAPQKEESRVSTARTAASEPPAFGSHRAAHLQRGALELSSEERVEREVESVFRVIADQLRHHRTLYGRTMVEARDAFELIDQNGSKTVDPAEFREALRRMDLGLTEDQVRKVLAATDADGNGTIDYEEFVARLEREDRYLSGEEEEEEGSEEEGDIDLGVECEADVEASQTQTDSDFADFPELERIRDLEEAADAERMAAEAAQEAEEQNAALRLLEEEAGAGGLVSRADEKAPSPTGSLYRQGGTILPNPPVRFAEGDAGLEPDAEHERFIQPEEEEDEEDWAAQEAAEQDAMLRQLEEEAEVDRLVSDPEAAVAARNIQARQRGRRARQEVGKLRQERAEQSGAAVRIQSVHRGKAARRAAAEAAQERRAREALMQKAPVRTPAVASEQGDDSTAQLSVEIVDGVIDAVLAELVDQVSSSGK